MRHHQQMSRRDFLKLLGATGLFFPISHLLHFTEAQSRAATNPTKPNFIILLFDTLSARHMSLYGYKRKTTPNIEKFATTSTTFHQHHAASNHTKPSTASLLTGMLPWSHRALSYYAPVLKFYENANIFSSIPSDFYKQAYTHNMFVTASLEQFANHIDYIKPTEDLAIYNGNKLMGAFKHDTSMGFYTTEEWSKGYIGPSNSLFVNPILEIIESTTSSKFLQANAELYPLGLTSNQRGDLFKLEDAIDWIAQSCASTPQSYLGYYHLLPPHEPYCARTDFIGTFSDDGFQLKEKPMSFFSQGYTQ